MNKKDIFFLLTIIVVIILAIQVLISTSITSYSPADWGLLLRLPLTFWVGLALLGSLLFAVRKSERRIVLVGILIFFFLFVIPTLVLENKAAWTSISYYRAYQIDYVLASGQIQFNNIDPWQLINWPGFFFIFAFASAITGLPTTFLATVFPIYVLALIAIISYAVLKIKFNGILSCLGALLVVASFYTGQEYFSPQATAFILYLAILLLIGKLFIDKSRSNGLSACILLIFVAAVTTHLLTSFLIMAGVIAVYLTKRLFLKKVRLSSFFSVMVCVLFISIFFFYQTIVISRTFVEVTDSLYGQIIGQDSHISQVAGISQNRVIGSTAYLLEIISTYGITISIVLIALFCSLVVIYGLFRRRPEAKMDVFWVVWIAISCVLGLSISYGGEGIARAFMFLLLPAGYFIVKYLGKKPAIIVAVIFVLLFVQIPASHVNENYIYIPSSELKGAQFLLNAPSGSVIFYEYLAPMTFSINETRRFVNVQLLSGFYGMPNSTIVEGALAESNYVVYSSLQDNVYNYFFGLNLLDSHYYYQNQSRLYDNGEFKIFSRVYP